MPQIIIMGLSGDTKVLPMTATKEKIVETVIEQADKLYTVTFIGDHFVTPTNVWASDEDNAEKLAGELLKDEYGWDIAEVSNEIEVEIAQ